MEIRNIELPLPTKRGAKVMAEVTPDGTIDVIVPKTLSLSEAKKAANLELNSFRYLVGVSSEVAEGLAEGYGAKAVNMATDAARKVRALYAGPRAVLNDEGKVNVDELKARMARAKQRAEEKDRDVDAAMGAAYRTGLRQAAQIERTAVTYAAAQAQAVVLHAAVEAIRSGRTARKAARTAQRPLSEDEKRKTEKRIIAKEVKRSGVWEPEEGDVEDDLPPTTVDLE